MTLWFVIWTLDRVARVGALASALCCVSVAKTPVHSAHSAYVCPGVKRADGAKRRASFTPSCFGVLVIHNFWEFHHGTWSSQANQLRQDFTQRVPLLTSGDRWFIKIRQLTSYPVSRVLVGGGRDFQRCVQVSLRRRSQMRKWESWRKNWDACLQAAKSLHAKETIISSGLMGTSLIWLLFLYSLIIIFPILHL